MSTEFTSISLLTRLRDNSSDAWSDFASGYEIVIRRCLSSFGANTQDVDDVMQEVMTFVFHRIADFEHNGRTGAFRNWLRQVTSNRLREHWRKQKRHRGNLDLGEVAEQLSDRHSEVSRVWSQEHDRFVLQHLLKRVAVQFQEKSMIAFQEVALKQRPAKEVADELGMSLGAVRVAQSRVLRSLKELGDGLLDE